MNLPVITFPNLSWLRSESELISGAGAKDDKLGLEEDVSEDGEPKTGIGLDTTKANRAGDRRVVHIATGNDSLVGADTEADAWKSRTAGESVSTLVVVKFGTGYLGIVGGDDGLREVQKGGTGVGNGING